MLPLKVIEKKTYSKKSIRSHSAARSVLEEKLGVGGESGNDVTTQIPQGTSRVWSDRETELERMDTGKPQDGLVPSMQSPVACLSLKGQLF